MSTMKMLLLTISLMLPALATPAFAQAPNDRAAELSAGRNYSAQHRAARRARTRHRSLFHRTPAADTNR